MPINSTSGNTFNNSTNKILDEQALDVVVPKITAGKIANSFLPTINYTNLQTVVADRLLGRIGTNGTLSEIPLGAGLAFTGGALVNTVTAPAQSTSAFITVGYDKADYIVDGTDDNVQIQQAIDYCSGLATGGTVYIKAGFYQISATVILKDKVNIYGAGNRKTFLQAKNNLNDDVIRTLNFSSESYGLYSDYSTVSKFTLRGFTVSGNDANQTDSGAVELNAKKALIKIYGYNFSLIDMRLEDAKEISLYTEHAVNWGGTFNRYEFGEGTFENIFIKNYRKYGWIMRGPHDSFVKNVKISSYIRFTGDPSAISHCIIELDTTKGYGSQGIVLIDFHPWGDATGPALHIRKNGGDKTFVNMVDSYVEGSQVEAIRLEADKCYLKAFVGYAVNGIVIDGNGNEVDCAIESNILNAGIKPINTSGGNLMKINRGTANVAMFDLTASGNRGGNRYEASAYLGNYAKMFVNDVLPGESDWVDCYHQAYPDSDSKMYSWRPVNGNNQTPCATTTIIYGWKQYTAVYLTSNTTLNFRQFLDGQEFVLKLNQDGVGSRLVTFPTTATTNTAMVSFGALGVPTLSTTAYTSDFLTFRYNKGENKMYLIDIKKNYA